jgi:hypothetical protein
MVHVEVAMKFFLYKLLGKKLVPITDYKDSIINMMLMDPNGYTMDLWGFVKREFNAEPVYNWKEGRNYLKFDNTQDQMMFLLKI